MEIDYNVSLTPVDELPPVTRGRTAGHDYTPWGQIVASVTTVGWHRLDVESTDSWVERRPEQLAYKLRQQGMDAISRGGSVYINIEADA